VNKKLFLIGLLSLVGLGLIVAPIEADFIQCVGVGECTGTEFDDVINGTPDLNEIGGLGGDDSIFAGDNPATNGTSVLGKESVGGLMFGVPRYFNGFVAEPIAGGSGDDFISGGPGSDSIYGNEGNDILLAGTDTPGYGQLIDGNEGNDTAYALVGEVTSCLVIYGGPGSDYANLLGHGPYSASQPFGITPAGWTEGFVHVVDPVGGGDIYIYVVENGDAGTEFINGLLSPNVTFIEGSTPPMNQDCILPNIW
jgi:Ca2+-binding RTX toxin-like protein